MATPFCAICAARSVAQMAKSNSCSQKRGDTSVNWYKNQKLSGGAKRRHSIFPDASAYICIKKG